MPAALTISSASPTQTLVEVGGGGPGSRPTSKFVSLGAIGARPVTRRHQMVYTVLLALQTVLLSEGLRRLAGTRAHYVVDKGLRLHRTLFYLVGTYLSLAAQLTSYRYLCLSPRLQQAFTKENVYLIPGLLRAFVDVVTLLRDLYRLHVVHQRNARERTRRIINGGRLTRVEEEISSATREEHEGAASTGQCMLCFESRKVPTAAVCGHIFCWECIRDWLLRERFCPLCRHECRPAELVPLVGYRYRA